MFGTLGRLDEVENTMKKQITSQQVQGIWGVSTAACLLGVQADSRRADEVGNASQAC